MQVYEMLQSSLWLLHTCCLMFFLTLVVFQKSFKRWMLVSQLCKPQLTLSASTRTLLGLTWLRQQLPKCLINYSWGSTAVRVWCNFCKRLHDALKLQKRVELGSVTLEQSLLLGLNFVKHETTQLLQCLVKQFFGVFSCINFCLLWAPDYISSTMELYKPLCGIRV